MVGRKEKISGGATKFVVCDVLVTPLPDKTGAAASLGEEERAKTLLDLLAMNYTKDGFKYVDWVSEFYLGVSASVSYLRLHLFIVNVFI